jgi:uncharacterized phiE125 gp8 family phage protein
MTKVLVAAPTVLAVTLADAKTNLRVDGTDLDSLITIWLQGIIAKLEHEIGQCIMEQTWEVRLDAFPTLPCWQVGLRTPLAVTDKIELPHPVISITSIKYIDPAGVEQTLDPAAYKIKREAYKSSVAPVAGTSWPETLDETNVVTVTVKCGYGNTAAATPPNAKLYILAKLVEQFDPATRTEVNTVQSTFIDALLDACRSYQ